MVNNEMSDEMVGETGELGGEFSDANPTPNGSLSNADRKTPVEEDKFSEESPPPTLFCSVPLNRDVQSIIDTFPKTEKKPPGRKLPCLYCDRTFVADNLRQKHVERCHSVKQARRSSSRFQQNAPPTVCPFCDKFAPQDTKLQDLFRHMVQDHPGKYFGCLECNERFIMRTQLREHNEDAHGTKVPQGEPPLASAIDEHNTMKTRHKAKIKEMMKLKQRGKRIALRSTKLGVKRSARLQSKVLSKPTKKRPKPKERTLEPTPPPKMEVKVPPSENPYPTFDAFYRVKKITDHSIDNLRIASLTFSDVFDQAFFTRIKCNIRENLLNHIDGKLFKNEESESRISNFEKAQPEYANTESYGCELSQNAETPAPSLLTTQFGDDPELQIEYGSKASKKKPKPDEVHYKYFTRRKYQASILESKENRDLSKLDMWTQYVIKNRQQKIVEDTKTDKERMEYKKGDEYRAKQQNHELNRILDRRGPFEDLKEEANKQAAMEGHFNHEAHTEIANIMDDILGDVFARVIPDIKTELTDAQIPEYLHLRKASLNNDSHIDRSDKITLICSSQETENFDASPPSDKNAIVELTGEWARSRLYICAACGLKVANLKLLMDHKNVVHQNVWCQHYEFVGNQGEFYRNLSIPGLGKMAQIEENSAYKIWRRSDARGCTKCKKQCNSLGELHRHILECGEDWSWMLVRKKCKYKPYGAKTRKKRRGLFKRIMHKEKLPNENREKKTYKKVEGPRPKPSDAETIQRMLANLPAKRATRKLICMKDGFPRKTKKPAEKKMKQQQVHDGGSGGGGKMLKRKLIKSVGMKCNPVKNVVRKSVRNLNKVISTKLIDSNGTLMLKRKLKNAMQDQRITRRSGHLIQDNSEEEKPPKIGLMKKMQNMKKSLMKKVEEDEDVRKTRSASSLAESEETASPVKKKKNFGAKILRRLSMQNKQEAKQSLDTDSTKNNGKRKSKFRALKESVKKMKIGQKPEGAKIVAGHFLDDESSGPVTKTVGEESVQIEEVISEDKADVKDDVVVDDVKEVIEVAEVIVEENEKVADEEDEERLKTESPKLKPKTCKRAKGLNACIAMLTSKLAKKVVVSSPDVEVVSVKTKDEINDITAAEHSTTPTEVPPQAHEVLIEEAKLPEDTRIAPSVEPMTDVNSKNTQKHKKIGSIRKRAVKSHIEESAPAREEPNVPEVETSVQISSDDIADIIESEKIEPSRKIGQKRHPPKMKSKINEEIVIEAAQKLPTIDEGSELEVNDVQNEPDVLENKAIVSESEDELPLAILARAKIDKKKKKDKKRERKKHAAIDDIVLELKNELINYNSDEASKCKKKSKRKKSEMIGDIEKAISNMNGMLEEVFKGERKKKSSKVHVDEVKNARKGKKKKRLLEEDADQKSIMDGLKNIAIDDESIADTNEESDVKLRLRKQNSHDFIVFEETLKTQLDIDISNILSDKKIEESCITIDSDAINEDSAPIWTNNIIDCDNFIPTTTTAPCNNMTDEEIIEEITATQSADEKIDNIQVPKSIYDFGNKIEETLEKENEESVRINEDNDSTNNLAEITYNSAVQIEEKVVEKTPISVLLEEESLPMINGFEVMNQERKKEESDFAPFDFNIELDCEEKMADEEDESMMTKKMSENIFTSFYDDVGAAKPDEEETVILIEDDTCDVGDEIGRSIADEETPLVDSGGKNADEETSSESQKIIEDGAIFGYHPCDEVIVSVDEETESDKKKKLASINTKDGFRNLTEDDDDKNRSAHDKYALIEEKNYLKTFSIEDYVDDDAEYMAGFEAPAISVEENENIEENAPMFDDILEPEDRSDSFKLKKGAAFGAEPRLFDFGHKLNRDEEMNMNDVEIPNGKAQCSEEITFEMKKNALFEEDKLFEDSKGGAKSDEECSLKKAKKCSEDAKLKKAPVVDVKITKRTPRKCKKAPIIETDDWDIFDPISSTSSASVKPRLSVYDFDEGIEEDKVIEITSDNSKENMQEDGVKMKKSRAKNEEESTDSFLTPLKDNKNTDFIETPDLNDSDLRGKIHARLKVKGVKKKGGGGNKRKPDEEESYCDICNKKFVRVDSLVKHKRTLTHIAKLSEIEAREADQRRAEIELRAKTENSNLVQSETATFDVRSPFNLTGNNDSLKLADIISDVLNKPVGENEPSFILNQDSYEGKRYKSLGERKSFDSDSAAYANCQPSFTANSDTLLEKQISILENIIEKGSFQYIDELSTGSNKSRCPSDMSLVSDIKPDDSNIISFARTPSFSEGNFVKPTQQYEDVSEDTRNFEEQRARKALNRDEELFLECCSLLKSSSEISNYSKKSSLVNTYMKPEDWLENAPKTLENSRPDTPIGDNYEDFSNSDTIKTDWKTKMNERRFEDISLESMNRNEASFNDFSFRCNSETSSKISVDEEEFKKNIDAQFAGLMTEVLKTKKINEKKEICKKPKSGSEPTQTMITDYTVTLPKSCESPDNKKLLTKGAMKIFEGLKVSIPTEELDMKEVLNCSPTSKRLEIENCADIMRDDPKNRLKNFGNKLGLKITKRRARDDKAQQHDVYDFEETQDNTDLLSNLRMFRTQSREDTKTDEDDAESKSFSMSSFSTESSMSGKKGVGIQNLTKKKCVIMGRIFKNAFKSNQKGDDVNKTVACENNKMAENYVTDLAKEPMTEQQMNILFDRLLEEHGGVQKDTKVTDVKSRSKNARHKKRIRKVSQSSDDEFDINKITKKRVVRKKKDNAINLEQELKECMGVAGRKSQRKCTSGKQNVLVEYWSSDDSEFEAMLRLSLESSRKPEVTNAPETPEVIPIDDKPPINPEVLKDIVKDVKQAVKRKSSTTKRAKHEAAETLASNRRKRAAAETLYYWSSSSDDEDPQNLIEVKAVREEAEDDDDRPMQHGWIVGDSPKKLVTMLAQAKGKKVDTKCVKEQAKKRTTL